MSRQSSSFLNPQQKELLSAQDDFIPCPDAGILRQSASPAGPTASEHSRKPSGAVERGPCHRHRVGAAPGTSGFSFPAPSPQGTGGVHTRLCHGTGHPEAWHTPWPRAHAQISRNLFIQNQNGSVPGQQLQPLARRQEERGGVGVRGRRELPRRRQKCQARRWKPDKPEDFCWPGHRITGVFHNNNSSRLTACP